MANITDVKLPDNSQYDLKDNVSGYAKKVAGATTDDLASLTATGDLADSGKKLSDLVLKSDVKDVLNSTSTTDPLSANQGRVLGEELSHRNLLDNPWFTVNQRGATTVTSGFGADRWQFVEGTSATYSSNGVSLDNSFICQILENKLPNGLYTASVKYQDGTIEHGTAIKADDSTAITFFTSSTGFKLMYIPLAKRFDVNGKNGTTTTIRAVKLELGSVSTLANDVAPDYALELAKCQTSTTDPSDTYANQGQLMTSALQGVLGAKNLFENVAISQTINGLVITKNADKSITCTSNNVALSNDVDILLGVITLPVGRYIVSNAHNSDAAIGGNNYFTYLTNVNGSASWVAVSTYDAANRILDITTETQIQFRLYGDRNEIFPATTFYPMIRDARITDPTYQPYAMTNRQLTERKYEVIGAMKSSIDMNTLLTGIHVIGENITNSPTSTVYGVCFCMNAGNTGTQLLLSYQGDMYYRMKTNGNWASWKTITAT